MAICVVDKNGHPLMPTYNIKKMRRALKSGRAKIFGHEPFTVQYTDLEYRDGMTQPVEICEDTGYKTIGVSVKSAKHEFFHEEYTLLADEKQHHDDARKYRRARRSRKRYRAPRFGNRAKPDGWMAPSIRNKVERHVDIIRKYTSAVPVTDAVLEVAAFDTQALEAMQEGKPLPCGADYQHGRRYGVETLRAAVFARDGHTCRLCGASSIKDGAILRMHHMLYWKGDHTDRMSGLATLCTDCHTPANHKKGGALYGWEVKAGSMAPAAFINTVRKVIAGHVSSLLGKNHVHETDGVATKLARKRLHIAKTHANDAFCMGRFHPGHRAETIIWKKRRRSSRVLEKFYDAVYIDTRTGKKARGAELSCGRTNRGMGRNTCLNLRPSRGKKLSCGRRSIRRKRYALQNGDVVLFKGRRCTVSGTQHYGQYAKLKDGPGCVPVKELSVLYHQGAWIRV